MLDKINNRLNEYEKKIESLTQTISDLQVENKNLQIKNLEHMKNRNYLLEIENNNKILSENQKMKRIRIKDLEEEILKVTEHGKEESRNIQKNLESEILYYKGLNETSLSKIYAADKIILTIITREFKRREVCQKKKKSFAAFVFICRYCYSGKMTLK